MMLRPARKIAVAATLTCVALLMAGCKEGGTATPSTGLDPASTSASASQTGATTPVASLPHSGAPKVANPMPRSVVAGSPCDAITTAQLQTLFGKAPTPERGEDATGPNCRWSKPETGASVTLAYTTKVPDGLSAVYKNTKPQVKLWREMTVDGYPMVAYNQRADAEMSNECNSDLGIADDVTVYIGLAVARHKEGTLDACEATKMVAEMVLTTLRGAA